MDYTYTRARLRDVFAKSGMTQKDFAGTCGLTQSTVTRLLSGKRAPELETLVKICTAFRLEPAYFVAELQQPTETSQKVAHTS